VLEGWVVPSSTHPSPKTNPKTSGIFPAAVYAVDYRKMPLEVPLTTPRTRPAVPKPSNVEPATLLNG
jgi:hypothetical protein